MLVVENPEGFIKTIVDSFAKPIVLIIIAAELLQKGDIKQDSSFAKEVIQYRQALNKSPAPPEQT